MKIKYTPAGFMGMISLLCMSGMSFAQAGAYQIPSQKDMLYSADSKLAANKKLVYDFWREVLEAGHLEKAPEFMTETYIQHNPNVPTGRQGFIDFFSKFRKPVPIADTIKGPLIDIVAENNMVVLVFKRQLPDPKDPAKKYITTSFDMLRIEGNLIAEHWDSATKD
jgi:predicted SnoaL-like aldol condensation-catalyzing enzyme